MFEILEPPERAAEPRWLFLMSYGTLCLVGLVSVTLSVRRHGLSQPSHLAFSCSMFFLSLMWLVATLRLRTALSSRKAGFRNIILLLLFLALNTLWR
jgi:hypothetical protein